MCVSTCIGTDVKEYSGGLFVNNAGSQLKVEDSVFYVPFIRYLVSPPLVLQIVYIHNSKYTVQ